MAVKSKISWCDSTWPIVNGCTKVSAGCKNCWACKLLGGRLKNCPQFAGLVKDGEWTGEVRCRPELLEWPMHLRGHKWIFVAPYGDLFHEKVPDLFIDQVMCVISRCPEKVFIVLTKRPERAAQMANRPIPLVYPDNLIFGVSIEDQATANERIPLLCNITARCAAVSLEPMIDGVDLIGTWQNIVTAEARRQQICPEPKPCTREAARDTLKYVLQWVIVGGEGGPGSRPCNVDDIRRVRDQCLSDDVPLFIKQLGSWPYDPSWHGDGTPEGSRMRLNHLKGADKEEWPEDVQIQQFPKGWTR